MDERYRELYAAIYVGRTTPELGSVERLSPFWLRPPLWDPFVAEATRDVIESAEREAAGNRRLREDARALLAVNMQDLIVLPLQLGGRVSVEEVIADVREDAKLLVAESRSASPEEPEISGHEIVDSLSRNWGRLRVSRFRLWERQ